MKITKGIILTGGTGSRLRPQTLYSSKHLFPVYNKLVIDFPLKTLLDIGVEDLTVVLGSEHSEQIEKYFKLNNNCSFKRITYVFQDKPAGIAEAINLCKNYIGNDKFITILGDNYFEKKIKFSKSSAKCQIVLCPHPEVKRFGVASIKNGKIYKIEEKPQEIDDNYDNFAITGLYLFDSKYFEYYKNIKPSLRGEFEVVDIIKQYHQNNELRYVISDSFWLDVGTFESIHTVSNRIREYYLLNK